jgi:hypothetical protein
MKFGRTYQMVIDGATDQWKVAFPFTCKFRISSSGTPSANLAHFLLYNLPERVRNDIGKDIYEDIQYRRISFSAGYSTMPYLPVVFVGNVFWAYSYRQGPDWITEINCLDGGWGIAKAHIEQSFPAGTKYDQIIRVICHVMETEHIKTGVISNNLGLGACERGLSICGNAWEELVRMILPINAQLFISNEVINVLAQNEHLRDAGNLTEISEDTGIIGSPRRQGLQTIATMVFEPRIAVGQKVYLKSLQPYAGDHIVKFFEHQGTISQTVCDDLVTRITFFRSPELQEVRAA